MPTTSASCATPTPRAWPPCSRSWPARRRPPARRSRRRRWGRIAAIAGGIAVVAVAAGIAVAAFSGQRLPGASVSGDSADSVNAKLAEARSLQESDPKSAIDRYDEVLKVDPDNAEALTYRGWLVARVGATAGAGDLVDRGEQALDRAIAVSPTYADPYCFKAIIEFRYRGDAAAAKGPVDICLAANPPQVVRSLVEGLQAEINAALAERPRRHRGWHHGRAVDHAGGMIRLGGGQGFYGDGVQPVADVLDAGVDYLDLRSAGRADAGHPAEGPPARRGARLHPGPAALRACRPAAARRRPDEADHQRRRHQPGGGRARRDRDAEGRRHRRAHGGDGRRRRRAPARRRARAPDPTRCSPTSTSGPGRSSTPSRQGADIVVTGRVADASLFLAPLVHELGWAWDDWDRLAAGVAVGHLLECSRPGRRRQLLRAVVGQPGPAAASASRSARSRPTAPPSSPSRRRPAAWSPSTRCASSSSTRCTTRAPTSTPT